LKKVSRFVTDHAFLGGDKYTMGLLNEERMADSVNSEGYCYREAADVSELYALLRLRYLVYRRGPLAGFVAENPSELDLDCHDCRSRHFGVFFGTTPVGYMRVIQETETHWAEMIREVASSSPLLFAKVNIAPKAPFPSIPYFPNNNVEVEEILASARSAKEPPCEAGRFALLPEHRLPKLGYRLVEASMAIFTYVLGFRVCLISCAPRHVRLYSSFCFHQVGTQAETIRINFWSIDRVLMSFNEKALPFHLRHRLRMLAERYQRTGEIGYGFGAASNPISGAARP